MKQMYHQKEEELQRRQRERMSQLEEHLKAQEKQLLEFHQFTEVTAFLPVKVISMTGYISFFQ